MRITDIKIRKLLNEDRVKGFVSIVIDDVFAVHDMKIIERQEDGSLFVAMPYRKTSQGKQRDIVHPINQETRILLEKAIIAKYQEVKETLEKEEH